MVSTETKSGLSNQAIGTCPTDMCESALFVDSGMLLLVTAARPSIAGGTAERYDGWPYMARVYRCDNCGRSFVLDDGEMIDVSEHLP